MSEVKFCHNCGEISHDTLCCLKRPQYSLCDYCSNICSKENGHRYYCTNKQFRSVYLGQDDMKEDRDEFLFVDFKDVEQMTLVTERGEMPINENPLWIQNCGLELRLNADKKIVFDAFTHTMENRTIMFSDQNNRRRIQLSVGKTLTVNSHYKLSEEGVIRYNMFVPQEMSGPINCWIKIYAKNDVFRSRFKWFGVSYIFNVLQSEVILVDPIEHYLQNSEEVDNEDEDGARGVDA